MISLVGERRFCARRTLYRNTVNVCTFYMSYFSTPRQFLGSLNAGYRTCTEVKQSSNFAHGEREM
jgi:hypothetical protein